MPKTDPDASPGTSSLPGKLKVMRNTFALGAILAVFTAPVHSGFMLYLTIPFFAVWLVYSLILMARFPERRLIQIIKMAFWAVLVASICGLHVWYAYSARQYAESVIAKVEKFEAEHKRCPASSEEIGITQAEMRKNLGYAYYHCEADGKPHLFYAVTYTVFETYHYDFALKTWKHLY